MMHDITSSYALMLAYIFYLQACKARLSNFIHEEINCSPFKFLNHSKNQEWREDERKTNQTALLSSMSKKNHTVYRSLYFQGQILHEGIACPNNLNQSK